MTNQEAKQEAIKRAYGKFFNPENERYVRATNINGWMNKSYYPLELPYEIGFNGKIMRPLSIKGIEDNNGWIRIEPDGSNLPKEGNCKVFNIYEGRVYGGEYSASKTIAYAKNLYITHYKPITPDKPPVY